MKHSERTTGGEHNKTMEFARHKHLIHFYSILDMLEHKIGGARKLADCSGRMGWPSRAVYFFHEAGEHRTDTGEGPRIVRVGTHALKFGAGTKLWTRLSQHKGQTKTGGGNHRGSIFRLIVGAALMKRDHLEFPTWGVGNAANRDVRDGELHLEQRVSEIIGRMPFLWLVIGDDAGPESLRGYIERNSIALLSNYNKPAINKPSPNWLGHYCDRPNLDQRLRDRVRNSGLWNSDYVDSGYNPAFLNSLEKLVETVGKAT